jgi:hypothetical protein
LFQGRSLLWGGYDQWRVDTGKELVWI